MRVPPRSVWRSSFERQRDLTLLNNALLRQHHVPIRLVFSRHYHTWRLLAALRQRRQQAPLPSRVAHRKCSSAGAEIRECAARRGG